MIGQCTELVPGSTAKGNKSSNGNYMEMYDDVFEHDMELVDQVNSGDDWDKMETEEADHSRHQSLLRDALQYGQELRIEFMEDRSKEVKDTLAEIFALFAYEDPRKSTTAPLLDQTGRVPVAEELNSAILGKLSHIYTTPPRSFADTDGPSIAWKVLLRRNRTSVPASGSFSQRS